MQTFPAKVNSEAARWFSDALLLVYAANSEDDVHRAMDRATAGLTSGESDRWLTSLLEQHADHRREQLRQDATAVSPAIARLTTREIEVLQRIAQGDTDAEIGLALGIATRTASKHVENILHKLGVETRTAAAAALFPR